jgi:uncharacterized protein YjeT (DUF2065 family)
MKTYILTAIAGIWLADGISLIAAPGFVIGRVRAAVEGRMVLWPWQLLSVAGGIVLGIASTNLQYQVLWMLCAGGMIVKGLFVSLAPQSWREPALMWSLGREDVDYRFWGLGLCAFGVLLLRALGRIGQG